MSTHDPQDGLTDAEDGLLRRLHDIPSTPDERFMVAWIRRLARENAALKVENIIAFIAKVGHIYLYEVHSDYAADGKYGVDQEIEFEGAIRKCRAHGHTPDDAAKAALEVLAELIAEHGEPEC